MIDVILNYLRLRKYVKSGILWQSSYLKNYVSKFVVVENHIMRKLINSIFDYSDNYISMFASKDYIFYNNLLDLRLQEKTINTDYDLSLLDVDKVIKVKSIAKDLFLLEIDNKQTLLAKNVNAEDVKSIIDSYAINKHRDFYELSLELLNDYSVEDLRNIFGSINNAIHLFKMLVRDTAKDKKVKFAKQFTFDLIEEIAKSFRFDCLYLCEDCCLSYKERKSNSYYLLLGSAGSGKTFTLMHMLFNVLLSKQFERVIFFDTQKVFDDYYAKLKDNYKEIIEKMREKYNLKIIVVNERNLFLSEIDLINAINYILESKGVVSVKEKQQTLLGVRLKETKNINEFISRLDFLVSKLEREKDYKEIWKLELTKQLLNIVKSIKIKEMSFFDYLTNNYLLVLQFDNVLYYDMLVYLFLSKLYNELHNREAKETWLFLDETQKYIGSETIQQMFEKLMSEKRQHGFRVVFTGLRYSDIKDLFKLTQTIILNDLSDAYIMNYYVLNKFENVEIEKHKEKAIIMKDENKVMKCEFKNYLFNE